MNFEIYLKRLNELAKKNPEMLKLEIIYSHDDEGNRFQKVHYGPTPGYFDVGNDDCFKSETEFEEDEYVNSICIN